MSNLKLKVAMKKFTNSKGYETVDHTNDEEMVREGLRLPKLFINRNVFKHRDGEKALLKLVRRKGGPRGSSWTEPESTHKFKLIVYAGKSSKVAPEHFKSTHSFMCYENEIPSILSDLYEKGYNIKQAFFNNKKVRLT